MIRLISLFISLLMLLPSYMLSFIPENFDKNFEIEGAQVNDGAVMINGEKVSAERDDIEGASFFLLDNFNCGWFNYFGIKYSSVNYVKGCITYSSTSSGSAYTEEFFLEPATEGAFYSFTDGVFDNDKAKFIKRIDFEALDSDFLNFELHGLGFFNREIPEEYVYIEKSGYKIGVNLAWGGALSYLEDTDSNVQAVNKDGRIFVDSNAEERYSEKAISKNVNLINRHDAGRLVQQSYYGTFDYENGEFMGQKWNYNPVQGGNQFGDCSKIVDVKYTDNSIYIKCRPLDWAKPAEDIAPAYMEATYSIGKGIVDVNCRFVDFSGLKSNVTTQECPAFYCIEPFNRFVYYSGDKPWTGDKNLSYENKLIFWPDAGYPYFSSTENWAAFIGEFDDSFGIGLYVPNEASFLAGVYDRENTTEIDPSVDDSTSYIAAVETLHFQSFAPIEYSYFISTGSIDEIRENFNKIR